MADFNVLDMANEYAEENNMDPGDLFNDPEPEVDKEEPVEVEETKQEEVKETPKKKREWMPDASVMSEMKEFEGGTGVVYDKKDLIPDKDRELKNGADEAVKESAKEVKEDFDRRLRNIEIAKRRHGIKHFQIPEGEYHARIMNAAYDHDEKKAQAALDVIFNEIKKTYPEFILDWYPDAEPKKEKTETTPPVQTPVQNDVPPVVDEAPTPVINPDTIEDSPDEESFISDNTDSDTATIIVDKRNVPNIEWTKDELDKIRRVRQIELNIVEKQNINFNAIEDADDNLVDLVLEPYQRRKNDTIACLPASRYRATFTGLTYPEVLDLSNSTEMNTIDGEKMKWTICFNHIKNPSIGPWEEYILYKDPVTRREIKIDSNAIVPSNVPEEDIHYVTKYEDFLKKTSFIDLDFMLWQILCATAMDEEIIQIVCHAKISPTKTCDNTYEWIYHPKELLDINSIAPAILEDMEKTGTVASTEDIMNHYNSSPVVGNDVVQLPTSGFSVVYGHVSAYGYLYDLFPAIKEIDDAFDRQENLTDPTLASKATLISSLLAVKAFLIPKGNKMLRVKTMDGMMKILNSLDEIDWKTIETLSDMMLRPYKLRFAVRDLVCPKCKNRSSVSIDNMAVLLFIIARSLASVSITLTKA